MKNQYEDKKEKKLLRSLANKNKNNKYDDIFSKYFNVQIAKL